LEFRRVLFRSPLILLDLLRSWFDQAHHERSKSEFSQLGRADPAAAPWLFACLAPCLGAEHIAAIQLKFRYEQGNGKRETRRRAGPAARRGPAESAAAAAVPGGAA